MAIYERLTAHILTFTNSVDSNIKGCFVSSFLNITDSVHVNSLLPDARNHLGLVQTVRVTKSIGVVASNVLALSQFSHHRVHIVEAYNGFIIWDLAAIPKHELLQQNLSLSQSVAAQAAKGTVNSVSFGQSVSVQVIKTNSVTSTLAMQSKATAWKVDKYFIGVPSLVYSSGPQVTFAYKGQSFNFQAPLLGNKESEEFVRINRQTIGGDTSLYRNDDWPAIVKHSISFDVCSEAQIAKIRELVKASLGDTLSYRDHNGVWFDGFISNPDTAIKQTGREAFTVSLELEVTPQ